ncbi:hypothetical protein OKA06_18950 [Novosphingobium sp. MW5]|nr:hypothetical protein [Novosphingobium sp. MW5]
MFLLIAGLSFLGLGIQPPTADWGSMVARERDADIIRRTDAAHSRSSHCAADGCGELRRRLDAVPHIRTEGGLSMVPKRDVLLEIRDLRIEGYSDEKWIEIVRGVDLTLHKGEVLGLIGESGCRKIDHRPGRHGLCPRRLPDFRRLDRVRRDGADDDL